MRILVAVQNAESRRKMVADIEHWDHSAEEALSEREIIQICNKKCPDLIILGTQVSSGNPFEIARQIRQTGGHALWVPIILLSDEDTEALQLQSFKAGIDDVLVEPVMTSKLQLKVAAAKRLVDMKEEVFAIAHQLVVENQSMQSMMNNQDVLTGLNNSASFEQTLEKYFKNFVETQKPLSLIYVNIDFFRLYNEKQGAKEGDEVMRKVSRALQEAMPKQGFVARIVGDTFAVLLPDTNPEDAFTFGNTLKEAVSELDIQNPDSGCSDRITVSFGVAGATEKSGFKKAFDLKDAADFGLYKAKHAGRNRGFLISESEKVNE